MKAAKEMGSLEKNIRNSTALLTSQIVVAALDSWNPEQCSEFLDLYRHSQWHKMYGMLAPLAQECSVRTASTVCDILAEVLEERGENKA